jgi:predicted DNA-binding transcriptional regulator AlpA
VSAEGKLTKEQLAARLGFSTRQLDYLVKRKELPAGKRFGRQLLWHQAVAHAWEQREFAEQLAWAEGIEPRTHAA